MSASNSSFWERLWPAIVDSPTARKVARDAFWAAIFVVGATTVLATLAVFGTSIAGINATAFVDAAIFGVVAVGIWRMSRVAAVIALVFFILEKLLMLDVMLSRPNPGIILVTIALLFAFMNGVRATFAYHRLQKVERDAAKLTPPPQDTQEPVR